MVETGGVGGRGGPAEGEVPFEEVAFERGGRVVGGGEGGEFARFAENAFYGGVFGVEGAGRGHGVGWLGGLGHVQVLGWMVGGR